MNALDLMKELGELGCRFRLCDIDPAIIYFTKMIDDGRVISIKKDNTTCMVITFSVTDDFEPYINKGFWEYKLHDPSGKTIYFEKLFSKDWDKEIRNMMKDIILRLYPQLETAIWHRDALWGDRQVTIKRRYQHV